MACQQRSCNNCQICDFSRISDYSPSMTTGFTANLHHSAQCEYKLPYMQHPYYCPQLCHVYIWVPNVQFFLCIFVLSDKISRCKQDTVEDKWRVSRENWPVRGLKNWLFFGLQTCVKFVIFEVLAYIWYQINQKLDHLSGNNLSVWYISNSISTMRGYVQPCFEPWTGRFSHNTHQMSGCHVYLPCVMSKLYVAYLSGYTVIPACVSNCLAKELARRKKWTLWRSVCLSGWLFCPPFHGNMVVMSAVSFLSMLSDKGSKWPNGYYCYQCTPLPDKLSVEDCSLRI